MSGIKVTVTNENSGFSKVVISPLPVWLGSSVFTPEWDSVLNKPSTFPPDAHDHPISEVTNLQTELDGKAETQHAHLSSDITDFAEKVAEVSPPATWETLQGKPTAFPPEPHDHSISEVTNLQTELDGKAPTSHQHTLSEISDYSALYQSAIGDSVLSAEVGGAEPEPASTWKTRTVSQALDTILFPTVPPSISTTKSVTLTVNGPSGVQEVGQVITRTLSATFNRGRITNGDGSLGPELVGPAMSFSYTGTGLGAPITTGNSATLPSIPILLGANNWAVTVTHEVGTGSYFDNKGNVSTVLDAERSIGQPNGSVSDSTSSPTITGVYPWYYLKSPVSFTATQFAAAIAAGNASNIHASAVLSKVIASASGTVSVPYNVNGQFVGVAYEATLTTKTVYYVTALDNGAITSVFNDMVTQNDVATALWVSNYKMHISKNALTNSNPTLQLRNT